MRALGLSLGFEAARYVVGGVASSVAAYGLGHSSSAFPEGSPFDRDARFGSSLFVGLGAILALVGVCHLIALARDAGRGRRDGWL